jgi:hypothetical protein
LFPVKQAAFLRFQKPYQKLEKAGLALACGSDDAHALMGGIGKVQVLKERPGLFRIGKSYPAEA